MAQLTLRDLSSNEEIVVPPEGYIFGRVGGDADIQLEDNTISRRQARVSLKGAMWLLETLAVPQGQRAPRPVQLKEGATFVIGQSEFEVAQIEAEDGEAEEDGGAKTIPPAKPAKAAAPAPAPAAAAGGKKPTAASTKAASPAGAAAAPKKTSTAAKQEAAGGGEEAAPKSFGALLAGVLKGIGYYLLNVPKLLVNPLGSVKKTLAEQPAEPMGRYELIGYAIPAYMGAFMLGSIAYGLARLIGPGHYFELMSFIPIGPAISGLISGIVTGFVWHPMTTWIITKLQGESDARSRTNYFLMFMTATLVMAVPNALGTILSAIPHVGVVGPLLAVISTVVMIYVQVQWAVHFKLHKHVKTVLLVLGALALIFTALGFVRGVIAEISSIGSGSSSSSDSPDVATGDSTGSGDVEEVSETPPSDPNEMAAWAEKRQKFLQAQAEKLQKKAEADAKAAQEAAEGGDKKEEKKEEKKEDAKEAKVEAKEPETKKADPKPEPKEEKPAPVAETKKDPPPAPVAVKEEPPPAPVAPVAASTGYATFARRREAIEKYFDNDPTVLLKNKELEGLYADYLDEVRDAETKYAKELKGKPHQSKLLQHLRDAELYNAAGKKVDQMAGKLGIK